MSSDPVDNSACAAGTLVNVLVNGADAAPTDPRSETVDERHTHSAPDLEGERR
jgi:hypothetical protein